MQVKLVKASHGKVLKEITVEITDSDKQADRVIEPDDVKKFMAKCYNIDIDDLWFKDDFDDGGNDGEWMIGND